jgi:hypothetical protein
MVGVADAGCGAPGANAASPATMNAGATSSVGGVGTTAGTVNGTGNAAAQLWQAVAATLLIASHCLQGLRCSGEAHALQNLASFGLRWSQNAQILSPKYAARAANVQ